MTHSTFLSSTAILMLAVLTAQSPSFAQTSRSDVVPALKIENFIGRITVKNGDIMRVENAKDGTLTQDGQSWVISGGEEINGVNCRARNSRVEISFGNWSWRKRSGGYKNINDYPHLKITLPKHAHLDISGSVIYGDIDDLGSAHIRMPACADITARHITGELDLGISGSGDFSAENIGTAQIRIGGSGDVILEDVGPLNLSISGSGDFDAESVDGDAAISVNGSGDIEVETITGNLEYKNNGSGDLLIDSLNGDLLDVRLNGSGDVEIDRGDVIDARINTNGSGDVDFGGTAVNADVQTSGSSDVRIKKASGEVHVDVGGSSDVYVNRTHYERD